MTIMHGRDFNAQDRGDSHLVAIISASLASSLFGNGPAVGQHLSLGNDSRHSDLEVVGVVNDANFQNLHEPNPLAVFTLLFQEAAAYLHSPQLAVRTQSDPASVSAPLRRVIESDTQYYPWRTEKLSALIDKEIITERLVTSVSVYFALPAVLLASVALYGLIAYTVISRAREIGIRMALGANRNKILFWMWIQAARPVAVGLLIGVLAATMMRHIFSAQISPLLKGASANDFAIISSATILMALVAALACFIPAWKATLINPVETLKQV
jgi:putative ABC transport system permease protein